MEMGITGWEWVGMGVGLLNAFLPLTCSPNSDDLCSLL